MYLLSSHSHTQIICLPFKKECSTVYKVPKNIHMYFFFSLSLSHSLSCLWCTLTALIFILYNNPSIALLFYQRKDIIYIYITAPMLCTSGDWNCPNVAPKQMVVRAQSVMCHAHKGPIAQGIIRWGFPFLFSWPAFYLTVLAGIHISLQQNCVPCKLLTVTGFFFVYKNKIRRGNGSGHTEPDLGSSSTQLTLGRTIRQSG